MALMFVVVTCRTMFWALCSVSLFLILLTAISTPKWLIGPEITVTGGNKTIHYHRRLGLYNRCRYLQPRSGQPIWNCGIYARTFMGIYSAAWRACIIFLGLSMALLGIAAFLAMISFCKQLFGRKSVINIAGTLQAIGGMLLIVVLVVFPVGWTTDKFHELCINDKMVKAKAFDIGNCSLGLSYYLTLGGMFGAFLCSVLSVPAAKSVFSDKVQDEILEGKKLICLF